MNKTETKKGEIEITLKYYACIQKAYLIACMANAKMSISRNPPTCTLLFHYIIIIIYFLNNIII
jgi:hypothetical protein